MTRELLDVLQHDEGANPARGTQGIKQELRAKGRQRGHCRMDACESAARSEPEEEEVAGTNSPREMHLTECLGGV